MSKQSGNGSKASKGGLRILREKEPDPLDEMQAAIQDGKDATRLLEYSEDFDEPTGRTDITVNLHGAHPPSPSQPQIEVTEDKPGVLRIVFTVVQKFPAWGAVVVALALIAAYVILALRGVKLF